MKRLSLIASLTLSGILSASAQNAPAANKYSAASYGSIQEALDKNPGRVIYVPSGDFVISQAIQISTNNSGLVGPGRIIQSNPDADIITINPSVGVVLRDITLTRPEGRMDTLAAAVNAEKCVDLVLDGLQVLNNQTRFAAVRVADSAHIQIRNCLIQDYMSVCIEDRTQKEGQGFAFRTINGTGMDVRATRGALVQGNRVIELTLLPTPEVKAKYDLGKFTKRGPVRGILVSQKMWDEGYNNVWHQGAAIHIGVPDVSDYIQIIGNYVENAAQGMDVQGDHVIVSQNIINNAFIGMKAMHGARNVLISNNQFSKNDLWSIGLMPGLISRSTGQNGPDGKPAPANVDGYSIIADNIISDFGYGSAYWMWQGSDRFAIRLDMGQIPANPPLSNVLIRGNIVYDTGKDMILVDGKPTVVPPRYKYAVFISTDKDGPTDLHFSDNIFNPGTDGVSNVDLKP